MTGPMKRISAALALSVALHTLVLAAAPAMFGAGAPADARQAAIEVRLLAEAPAAPVSSKARRTARKAGSDPASEPGRGVVDGPRYLRASELDSKPAPLTSIEPAAPAGTARKAGRVVARVLINESGAADAVRIESSEPKAVFDDAVKSAFGGARYRPGMKEGRNVKSQMRVEVTFHPEPANPAGSPRPH